MPNSITRSGAETCVSTPIPAPDANTRLQYLLQTETKQFENPENMQQFENSQNIMSRICIKTVSCGLMPEFDDERHQESKNFSPKQHVTFQRVHHILNPASA